MSRESVSAVIPAKNVEHIIIPTLESLRFCDEVVVVDMFSTDKTREVCALYPNVRFFEREDYIYGNFNFGVEQATSTWIIRIDSDEVVSDELRESIVRVLEGEDSGFDAYQAFCHLYFFGKRLHHGFGNQWRTMLFRRGFASYQVKSEHEGLTLKGPEGRLQGHYDHYSNATITIWLDKLNYYSSRDVERVANPTPLSRTKVIYQTLRTFQRFYLGSGQLYKDGYLGLVVAGITAFSIFVLNSKLWEKSENQS